MILSDKLMQCRSGRPDERKMDEFIRDAKSLESELKKQAEKSIDFAINYLELFSESEPDLWAEILAENKYNIQELAGKIKSLK